MDAAEVEEDVIAFGRNLTTYLAGSARARNMGDAFDVEGVAASEVVLRNGLLIAIGGSDTCGTETENVCESSLWEMMTAVVVLSLWPGIVGAEVAVQGLSETQTMRTRVPKRKLFGSTIMVAFQNTCLTNYYQVKRG